MMWQHQWRRKQNFATLPPGWRSQGRQGRSPGYGPEAYDLRGHLGRDEVQAEQAQIRAHRLLRSERGKLPEFLAKIIKIYAGSKFWNIFYFKFLDCFAYKLKLSGQNPGQVFSSKVAACVQWNSTSLRSTNISIEGAPLKRSTEFFSMAKIMSITRVRLAETVCSVQKIHFLFNEIKVPVLNWLKWNYKL